MAELNLKQIIDKLNTEFTGENRKLIFWYDDNGDFEEDIDSVEIANAKVYKLTEDNQFYTKYFLEKEDTKTNYLIYAPFSKPRLQKIIWKIPVLIPNNFMQIEHRFCLLI